MRLSLKRIEAQIFESPDGDIELPEMFALRLEHEGFVVEQRVLPEYLTNPELLDASLSAMADEWEHGRRSK